MNSPSPKTNMGDLTFKPMSSLERGAIRKLLRESYRCLPQMDKRSLGRWERDWKRFDDDIFNHPGTIGASAFVTSKEGTVIGFASWDPRKYPLAIVGHNCILPKYRGHGYGKQQLKELLRRIQRLGFTKARTTTGDHPGFLAAQRMYLACGFQVTRRFSSPEPENWKLIELEKEL